MTVREANELRSGIGFPLIRQKEMDPDVINSISNDIINYNDRKTLSLLDCGFVIPKSSIGIDAMCMNPTITDNYYDERTKAYFLHLSEAMCVYSTKSRKNLISKAKIKFIDSNYCYSNYIQNKVLKNDDVRLFKNMYIWRFGTFVIKKNKSEESIEKGYELTILNEKMQIQDRAYYIELE